MKFMMKQHPRFVFEHFKFLISFLLDSADETRACHLTVRRKSDPPAVPYPDRSLHFLPHRPEPMSRSPVRTSLRQLPGLRQQDAAAAFQPVLLSYPFSYCTHAPSLRRCRNCALPNKSFSGQREYSIQKFEGDQGAVKVWLKDPRLMEKAQRLEAR